MNIMQKRKTVKFSEALSIINGKNQKAVVSAEGKYPIYGSGGIIGRATAYICGENTVIIGRKGSINNPIFSTEKLWNVDTAFGLVANQCLLLPRYLYYFCVYFDFEKLNTTVTIPSLTKANLLKITISLPSLKEQKRIAALLDKVEELISLRKQQIEKLDLLVKSQFIDMFGDPVTNPNGWVFRTLREISTRISDGPFGSNLKSEHYTDQGIRILRLQNIGVGCFVDDDRAYVSQEHYETLKKYTCLPGDVIIGTMGNPNLRACLLPSEISRAINKADCVQCRVNKELMNPFYLCALLNIPETLTLASSMLHGQTRTRISMGQLASFGIPCPALELQNQFASFVESVEKQKAQMQIGLEKLELNYKALMAGFFEG